MIGKKGMAVAGVAVAILLALTPLAMAHNTSGASRAGGTNGVSGNYVGPGTAGAVDCLDSANATGAATQVPGGTCFSILFPGTGWGAAGQALCDVEYLNADETDETVVDDTTTVLGVVPDGTWDDGGQGGACHVSNYVAPPNGYNTDPDASGSSPGGGQTADTKCTTGTTTAYASDAIWGGDVPILAGCHYADFTNDGGGSFTSCVVNAIVASSPVTEKPGALVACATIAPSVGGTSWTCMGTNATSGGSVNLINLGKGGDGVSVPDPNAFANPCPTHPDGSGDAMGDVVVFVNALVSANPACQTYVQESPNTAFGEEFGWDCSARWLANDANGLGDTIVYLPLAGWIDVI